MAYMLRLVVPDVASQMKVRNPVKTDKQHVVHVHDNQAQDSGRNEFRRNSLFKH